MSVKINKITYQYDLENLQNRKCGIFDISLSIKKGECIGIIGHTGSGKSTLMQNLNGLYLPQKGSILIDGILIDKTTKNLLQLRKKVGLVFQYPEDQLFEETVFKDISFGPKNLGLNKEEIYENVYNAMKDIGLNFDKYKERCPHELSGGEKRKVATASVLAMNPEILILDEPMAGLDLQSKKNMYTFISNIRKKRNITIFLVSHDMDDIFLISDKVIIMKNGKIVLEGSPEEVFSDKEYLFSLDLGVPYSVEILDLIKKNGYNIDLKPRRKEELIKFILKIFKDKKGKN